jgi:hypothetical protein
MIPTEKLSSYTPFQFCHSCGIVMRGRMAEWSIAAVLKTAGLTAPGVRIPLLPLEGISSTAIGSGIKCMSLSNIPGYSSWLTVNLLEQPGGAFHQAHLTRLSQDRSGHRATLSGSVQVLAYGCVEGPLSSLPKPVALKSLG